jgi:hypothetical protein
MPQWLQDVNLADLVATLLWVFGGVIVVWKVWPILRAVRHVTDRVKYMLDDWFGEPSRPGVPERPGVMVRLDRLERVSTAAAHSSALAAYDSAPNHGESAMDHLKAEMHAEFAELNARISNQENRPPDQM